MTPYRYHAAAYASTLIAAIAAAIFYAQFWLSHDVSWYLIATRKFLEGARLYVDIIEINPPLNFYLTIPALYLADLTGLTDTVSYVLYATSLGCLSGLWLARIVLRAEIDETGRAILLLAGLLGIFVLPISDFAQREHLLLIFALPYFYAAILGDEQLQIPRSEQFLLGLIATLGLALKPYFLPIAALIALVGPLDIPSLRHRIFSPRNLGLATGLLGYAYFVVGVHPEYFSNIVPLATKVYAAYGKGALAVFWHPEVGALFVLAAMVARAGWPRDRVSQRLCAATIAALAAYLVQFKGWDYQLIPFSFFLVLCTVWIAHVRGVFARRDAMAGILAASIVGLTLGTNIMHGPYRSASLDLFSPFVDRSGQRIAVYSTNLPPAFPFINAVNGVWSSRFPAQWTIPGAYQAINGIECKRANPQCDAHLAILSLARSQNVADFLKFQPELVFVDVRERKSYFGGLAFDYIAFLSEDPAFAAAWSACRKVATIEAFAYEAWRCEVGANRGPAS